MRSAVRLTAVDRTEHLVDDQEYDCGVETGWYGTACGQQVRAAAMVAGPERSCSDCLHAARPIDWRKPRHPGPIERWLRKVAAA